MKRKELKRLILAEMGKALVWDEINEIVDLEELAWFGKRGVSTPGDVIPVPMDELDAFLEGKTKSEILLMGVQSERYCNGAVHDGANLNDEYFCLGQLGYFTTIPESERCEWLGSFTDDREVVDYADDDELEGLAGLYKIEIGEDGIEEDDE